MPKSKTVFTCGGCGYETGRWLGRCPDCGVFNSFEESIVVKESKSTATTGVRSASGGAVKLRDVKSLKEDRFATGLSELDRVLSGGIVPGSLVLLGGEPGIGKSTILLQICQAQDFDILYVSGEESPGQIMLRATRLGEFSENVFVFAETNLTAILGQIEQLKPQLLIIDSIQTMTHPDLASAPGSITQVREATAFFMRHAKERGMATIIVGHVTKDGAIAGPKILEHMVDCVLYFEGERHGDFRLLRATKNRFGAIGEIGIFEMAKDGLKTISNPSEYMLTGRPVDAPGSVITCAMEGTRPILAEVQALVARTHAPNPRRAASGTDLSRMNMLVAMMEKRLGMPLSSCDCYINIAGGMKLTEPAGDLAAIAAVATSFKDKPINSQTLVFGEVGLAGEVRAVTHAQRRLDEAAKLGFEQAVIPQANLKGLDRPNGMKVYGVSNIAELLKLIFV